MNAENTKPRGECTTEEYMHIFWILYIREIINFHNLEAQTRIVFCTSFSIKCIPLDFIPQKQHPSDHIVISDECLKTNIENKLRRKNGMYKKESFNWIYSI